jgi:hypothetical protein
MEMIFYLALAAGTALILYVWLPGSRSGLAWPRPHSGSYKGYRWLATVGVKGIWGRYFAFLDDLRTADGTRLDPPLLGDCGGFTESEATMMLDAKVCAWIDNISRT